MKILIWGIDRRAAMHFQWLKEHYELMGFVCADDNAPEEIMGFPVIRPESVKEYEWKKIVIVVEPEEENAVREVMQTVGLPAEDAVMIDELLRDHNDYLEDCAKRQLAVIQEIIDANESEISDYDWMYRHVVEYGVCCFQKGWYKLDPMIRWCVYGLQQVPEEFARFCVMLASMKIDSTMEIGVYRGRSAYFMCAVLARNNPELMYHMVDIQDRLDNFDRFHDILPQLRKEIPSSSGDHTGEEYDFVFIDADHSYDGSMEDYEMVGKYARKMVGFHDIFAHEYDHENGGTVRTWKEVSEKTSGYGHKVFSVYPDMWMGIGCVLKEVTDEPAL